MEDLNSTILATIEGAPKQVSENTARKWMHLLGFHQSTHKKGFYVDGHERVDVVQHRIIFLAYMETVERRMKDYSGDDRSEEIKPTLGTGEKEVVFVTHDECLCYANDGE